MAAQLSNAELADMHLANGAANVNARQAARLYQERFPNRYLPGHRMFTSIHRRLREHGSFTGRMAVAGRPRGVRDIIEEDVLDYFRNKPSSSTRAAARDMGIPNHMDV